MGAVHGHEFVSLDGVIDTPSWTIDYGFLPGCATATVLGGHFVPEEVPDELAAVLDGFRSPIA